MCAVEWLQSTVHVEFDVVPPPGMSKKRAIVKLIGHSLRRVSYWDVVPPPGPPTRRARSAKVRCCGLRRVGRWCVSSPRMSKKRAIVKLIWNSIRRVSYWDVVPPPDPPTKQAQGTKLN